MLQFAVSFIQYNKTDPLNYYLANAVQYTGALLKFTQVLAIHSEFKKMSVIPYSCFLGAKDLKKGGRGLFFLVWQEYHMYLRFISSDSNWKKISFFIADTAQMIK